MQRPYLLPTPQQNVEKFLRRTSYFERRALHFQDLGKMSDNTLSVEGYFYLYLLDMVVLRKY